MRNQFQSQTPSPGLPTPVTADVRGKAPTRDQVTDAIAFLENRIIESNQQAEKETGSGRAFFQGRAIAFELSISVLRDLIANV